MCTQQSRQATLVPSMSLPAGSDTVTSLYRVLFHLSLMVLVCCWSQTQILLCMNFTTCFTHYSQGTRLFEDTPCTESCRRHIGCSPISIFVSRGVCTRNAEQTSTQEANHPPTRGILCVRVELTKLPIRTQALTASVYIGSGRRVQLILPQVHLRKLCYDFSFL